MIPNDSPIPTASIPPIVDRWSPGPQVWLDPTDDGGGAPAATPSGTEGGAPAAAAGDAPAGDGAPTPTPPADGSDTGGTADPFADLPEQAVFDRGYVERLRREGATYRTRANELTEKYEPHNELIDTFSQYPEADQQAWQQLMTDYRNDPVKAADMFQQIAQTLLEDSGVPADQAQQQAQVAADQQRQAHEDAQSQVEGQVDTANMTPEQVQQLVAQEMQNARAAEARQREVEGVFQEIEKAGYAKGTAEAFSVLWRANNETNGDIAAAIAAEKASRQKIIDDYVNGVAGDKTVTAPDGTPGSQTPEPPKTFADASDRVRAMLASSREQT